MHTVSTARGRPNPFRWVWRLGVTVIVVYAANRAVSVEQLASLLGRVQVSVVVMVLALGIAAIALHAVRWKMALDCRGVPVTPVAVLRTYLWGTALAFVTPGRLGEFVRGIGLSTGGRLSSVEAVAIDKFYVAGAVLMTGCAGGVAHLCLSRSMPGPLGWAVGAWFAGLAGWTGVAVWRGPGLTYRHRLIVLANGLWSAVRSSYKQRGLRMLVNALLAQGLLVIQTALLLEMFGGGGLGRNLVVAGEAFALMLLLPFSIGNMGVREFSLGVFWTALVAPGSSLAPPATVCLGTSVVILIVNIILPALVGAGWEVIHLVKKPVSGEG